MQLSELLYQRVKDLGERGQLALKPGYCAVVGKSRALRRVLLGALYPRPEDARELAAPPGPSRLGAGLAARDGSVYRVLRDLASGRTLHRFDPGERKFALASDDDLEIDAFLRSECGLPGAETYAQLFVFAEGDLPSRRAPAAVPSAPPASAEQARVKQLRDELEQARTFEGVQDRLFKVAQRLEELKAAAARLEAVQRREAELRAEVERVPFSPQQIEQLAEKARNARADQKKRDDQLAEVARHRGRLEEAAAPPAEPLLRDPLFGVGLVGGALLDGVAFALRKPPLALLGLLPFAAALLASLRWIAADEAFVHSASEGKRLKEREDHLRRTHADGQAQLKAAMKAVGVVDPEDLLGLLKAREQASRELEEVRARLQAARQDPDVARAAVERPRLEAEKEKLEADVMTRGYSRSGTEIEAELRRAQGGSADAAAPGPADADVPRALVAGAASLLQVSPADLWAQLAPRLGAYLAALTEKRLVAARPDPKGLLVLSTADGRAGPYHGLPPPLKDLAYAALRLAVLERAAGAKKLPAFVDGAFDGFDPARRALAHKMLKGISALSQVIHRTAEPPPQGLADLVAQAP